jgi:hypothetical protein
MIKAVHVIRINYGKLYHICPFWSPKGRVNPSTSAVSAPNAIAIHDMKQRINHLRKSGYHSYHMLKLCRSPEQCPPGYTLFHQTPRAAIFFTGSTKCLCITILHTMNRPNLCLHDDVLETGFSLRLQA